MSLVITTTEGQRHIYRDFSNFGANVENKVVTFVVDNKQVTIVNVKEILFY